MRKGRVVGSSGPGGLTTHGTDDPSYKLKFSAQVAREKTKGGVDGGEFYLYFSSPSSRFYSIC
jgi:hypothetical protein